jgi:hypothetical protein
MSNSREEMMVEMSDSNISSPVPSEEPSLDDTFHESALAKAAAPHSGPKKNSLCYDIFMPILVISLFVSGLVVILVANNWRANDPAEIAKIYHEKHPFIDGKNQLPYAIKYAWTMIYTMGAFGVASLIYKDETSTCFSSESSWPPRPPRRSTPSTNSLLSYSLVSFIPFITYCDSNTDPQN